MPNRRVTAFAAVERTSNPRLAFAILAIAQSTLIFTIALIMIPLPIVAAEFALSASQILLLQVAYGLPFSGLLLFGGTYLQQIRGWTPFETAASFLPFAVALIGTNLLAAPAVGRFGAEAATIAGFLIAGLSLAWLTVLDPGTGYLTVLLPAQALLAIGVALAFSGAAVLATTSVPHEQMGLAGGVMNTAMELGPTVGFALLMAVAATRADIVEGYAMAFGAAAASYGVAAAFAWLVTTKRRRYGARRDHGHGAGYGR